MPSNDTTTKFRADISQLKSQMQAAARAVKVATSEFKAATAGLDDWSKSADGLQAKLKQLDTTLSSQTKQLDLMEDELEKTVKVYGENSSAADQVRIKINNQKAAIAQTQKQIAYYNQELEDCKNGVGKFAKEEDKAVTASEKLRKTISDQEKELEDLKKAYQDAKLDGNAEDAAKYAKAIKELSGELKDNKSKLSEAEKAADSFDDSLEDMDDAAAKASEGFTVMKGALANLVADGIRWAVSGLKDLATEAFKAGANFESAMSNVAAISGASAEELDKLTAKAKEMGESTVFSASQSAEAFNYMAMAGWKTEDMLNGIEGIMNLAAASGEDLATTSDIVTDALTAMGYSAGDAGRLADVMAAASSNANTNVAMMGATFQYAAPVVGALGLNMEDTAVAIGMMANAGIKGEKAGTALRSILTRLSTDAGASANQLGALGTLTEELGVQFYNTDGTVRDLNDILVDSRKAWAGLSAEQQTSYAKTIAGQEAMAGWLAIMNGADADFNKLTKAVNESSGAAKKMSETMTDNVNGSITLLKSNIEGKMIKVFEKASDSIKKSVRSMGRSLDSLDWDKIGNSVGKLAKKFADFVNYVAGHTPQIVRVLKTLGTVMLTVFAVNKISTFTRSIQTLGPLFTALATKIGLVTVATEGQTAATLALNTAWLASPITWVIASLAALGVAYAAYNKHVKAQVEAEYGLSEAQKENIEIAKDLKSAYDGVNESRKEATTTVNSEYGYLKQLKDEYNGLIDSNGKVKKGYEDRANFILNKLAEAMNVEIDAIKEEIDENGKLGDSIDKLIEKKKAEALLAANQDAYNQAIRERTEAFDVYAQAQEDVAEAEKKWKDSQEEYNDVMKRYNEILEISPQSAFGFYLANKKVIDGNKEAKKSYDEAKEGLAAAEEAYIGYNTTIQNYEGLSAAIIAGDSDKINQAMTNLTYNFQTAETSNRESLERQVKDLNENYQSMKEAIENNTPGITQEMVDQAGAMVEAAKNELKKLPDEAADIGNRSGYEFATGAASMAPEAQKSGEVIGNSLNQGASISKDLLQGTGKEAGVDFSNGLGAQGILANQSGNTLANEANRGTKTSEKLLTNTGTTAGACFTVGVNSKSGDANGAGKNLASNASAGSQTYDPGQDPTTSGSHFGEGFFNGIGSWVSSVWEQAKNLAKSAWNGLRKGQQEGSPSKLTTQSGKYFGQGYYIGINKTVKDVVKTATNLAIAAYDAIDTQTSDFGDLGTNAGVSFSDGLKASMVDVKKSINDFATPLEDIKLNGQVASATVNNGISQPNASSAPTSGSNQAATQNFTFNQYNNSPEPLDRLAIYRDTNSLLFNANVKARLSNV